jgi:arylsulfatase
LHFPVYQKNGKPLHRGNDITILPGSDSTYMSYSREWANASNTPFRLYKQYIHEGGISTPLIAYWPAGIKSNSAITNQLGHIIDIMPTCLDVAGAVYPEKYKGEKITPLEGQSLRPAFENKTVEHHPIGWEHEGNKGFRDGKWKLVSCGSGWELYDMESDRTELKNLSTVYPEKKNEMIKKYEDWATRVGVVNWNERRNKK